MLVLIRRNEEEICLGPSRTEKPLVTIKILHSRHNLVRIGIDAPREYVIWRPDYQQSEDKSNE